MTDMKKSDAQFPLVSICIISYNSAKTIIETIDSVAAQMRYIDAGVSVDWGDVEIVHNNFYINPQRVIETLDE